MIVVFAIFICPKVSVGYGYKRNEDPLITVFKSVIFYGRKGDWAKVESDINSISDRIDDVKTLFDVDLRPKLDAGLAQHNFQEVIKAMANLVFFAMREKYYWNLDEKLQKFTRAKVRLRLVEEYYTTLLAGNVRKYDKLNDTKIHDEIFSKLKEARKTLGSLGFLGAGAVSPKPKEFEMITKEIEEKLLIVFPYFESGKETTY
ncbi:MAG: hypothetical protein ACE5GU_08610 [Candidatus Scalinduaceae bacterium]